MAAYNSCDQEHSVETSVKSAVKIVYVILLGFLVGCAARPSYEQLEEEALASGDWSAVEKREEFWRRHDRNGSGSCQAGTTKVCIGPDTDVECQCVKGNRL